MRFEFATAGRIIFGQGCIGEVVDAAPSLGRQCLIVTGKSSHRWQGIVDRLKNRGLGTVLFQVASEPTTAMVRQGLSKARENGCDCVLAIGGGSAMDTAKAVAAMMSNPAELTDYLEVVGKARPQAPPPAPYIAVPTTAGTGSEVTRNAVIIAEEHGVKVSIRSPLMLPRLVVVDPELTISLPPGISASTGLDALTQLVESFVSSGANPLTDGICREGLTRACRSIRTVYEDGRNANAREDMALASLFSGIALANARLGAVHGFAAAVGGRCGTPHGLICAALLPHVMEVNVRALRRRMPESQALERFKEVARIMTGKTSATAEDGIGWLKDLGSSLHVEPLHSLGIDEGIFPELVTGARRASSMKGNPIVLTDDELAEILHQAR
jgi:alcohol dehydrogenase class IV